MMRTLRLLALAAGLTLLAGVLRAQPVGVLPNDTGIVPLTLEVVDADGDLKYVPFGQANYGPTVTDTLMAPAAWGFTAAGDSIGCEDIVTDLTGKWAIIRRGVCQFTTKVAKARRAGAEGVVICNDNRVGGPGFTITMAPGDSVDQATIPSVFLSELECRAMAEDLDAGNEPMVRLAPISLFQGTAYWMPFVPEKQADLPFPSPRAVMYNPSTTDSIINGTLSVTYPDGDTEVLATLLDTIQPQDAEFLFFFDANVQLNRGQGVYEFLFETDIPEANSYVQEVTVTEDYFQTEEAPIQAGHVQITEEAFGEQDNLLRFGAAFVADADASLDEFTFGICNGADLVADGVAEPFIEVFLVDVDLDDDGNYDAPGAETLLDFPGANTIGLGEYEFDGSETCSTDISELISVAIADAEDDALSPDIIEGKTYAVYAEFSATGSGNTVVPMVQSGFTEYDGSTVYGGERLFTTLIETSNIFSGFLVTGDGDNFQSNYQDNNPFSRITLGEPGASSTAQALAGDLALMPNPASEVAQLRFALEGTPTRAEVVVRSLDGKVALRLPAAGQQGTVDIPTSGLANGVYSVRLVTDLGARSQLLTVAH